MQEMKKEGRVRGLTRLKKKEMKEINDNGENTKTKNINDER